LLTSKIKEAESSEAPLKSLLAQLEKQGEYLEEKRRFLLEVKIDDILEDHPEWTEQIYKEIENFEYAKILAQPNTLDLSILTRVPSSRRSNLNETIKACIFLSL
jgi:hypothetical protein